jgi:hypothetical protein
MKNIFKLFGIIALVAVIGFSMAACGGDDGGGNGNGNGTGGGGASTFTLTGIPSKYNGMKVEFAAESPSYPGVAVMNRSSPTVSNGKVSFTSLWVAPSALIGAIDYTENETIDVVHISIKSIGSSLDYKGFLRFYSVKFSNGSASRTWSEADEILEVE